MAGKIACLSQELRDQVNERLQDGEQGNTLLPWLNALPEVQAVLKDKFDGVAISEQNLSQYRQRGFLDWQSRQQALEFAATLGADDGELQKVLPTDLADKLERWITVRYAAATRALSTAQPAEMDKQLRHLRSFCLFILGLRRGELSAGRLAVEQQRLAIELGETAEAKEKEFWEWTKRPDIQAKLYPNRNEDQIRRDVVRMLDREMLGLRTESQPEETDEPGMLI